MAGQTDARSTKYDLFFGSLKLEAVKLEGLKSERVKVDRADRTRRTTDQIVPQEITMDIKVRDSVLRAALNEWRDSKEHIDGVCNVKTETGQIVSIYNIVQACPSDFEISTLSTQEDASEIIETWTFVIDDVSIVF